MYNVFINNFAKNNIQHSFVINLVSLIQNGVKVDKKSKSKPTNWI